MGKKPKQGIIDGFRVPPTFDAGVLHSAQTFEPSEGDVMVATYPKCGTTWVQQIVILILRKGVPPASAEEYWGSTPFLEVVGQEGIRTMLRPGVIKTHLPFDRVTFSKKAKYIFVARHPADCSVSYFHHMRYFPIYFFSDGTFDDFFDLFLKGEVDFGDYFDHLLSWYKHKDEPNLFLITFEDIKRDHRGAVLKIAKFFGEDYYHSLLADDEKILKKVLEYSSVDYMQSSVGAFWKDTFQPKPSSFAEITNPVLKKYDELVKEATAQGHTSIGEFVRKEPVPNMSSPQGAGSPSLHTETSLFAKIPKPQSSPRRGKGRSTAKFNSLKGSSSFWNSERRAPQIDTRRYQTFRGKSTKHFITHRNESLAAFKMAPCVVAENKPRPFMGSCCSRCFPLSRAAAVDKRVFCLSVCNVFHIPPFQRCDVNYVMSLFKRNQKSLYPDIELDISKNKRILQAVQIECDKHLREENDHADSNFTGFKVEQLNKAKEVFESVKSSISIPFLQFSSLFLHFVLNKVFDGILVHKGQMEIIRNTSQENVPIVYLPVHRSFLDFFLISYILHMKSLKLPLVMIEDDDHIPFFKYISRFLGAIFVKKAMSSDVKRDKIYTAVLQSYLAECLKSGYNLECFVDGGRSRSGKPKIFNPALLTVAIQSILEENIEDIYISTISVSYEKIIEGDFIDQQLGQTKNRKNLFTTLYSIWKILHLNFGYIRFNFGQPFSLKEFLQRSKQNVSSQLLSVNTPPSSSDESNEEATHIDKSHLRTIVHNLSNHIAYDATASTSIMSTQLVAFLFITQFRKGATQQQLQNSLNWLRGELLAKKRDTGFSGESLPVVKRAVELLGRHLVTTETIDVEWTSSDLENNNVKVTVYKPTITLPHVLELQYYANTVVPVFLMDSLLVNALYSLVNVEICHFRHCDSQLYVLRDRLVDKAIELNDMLQFEFITFPPCADISLLFSDVLDGLIAKDCLHVVGMGVTAGPSRYNRNPHHLSFESEEECDEIQMIKEQQLKIDLSEESISHLEFLRSILSPYIESYWLAACTLLKLVDEIKEENVFIQDMQSTAEDKVSKGFLAYEESFSADTFRNSLQLFEKWHVVEHYMQDGVKIVYLNDSYNYNERVNDIIARIEDFRK